MSVSVAGLFVGSGFLLLGVGTLINFFGFGRWYWSSSWNWFWKDRIDYRGWRWLFGGVWSMFGLLFIVFSV